MEEITGRRIAVYLASGLTLAVLLGLAVFKLSDAGVSVHPSQDQVAGQPVAAADPSPELQAPTSEETAANWPDDADGTVAGNADADGTVAGNGSAGAAGAGSGAQADPLAPRNANLDGARAEDDAGYYRPTNASQANAPRGGASANGVEGATQTSQPAPVKTPAAQPNRADNASDSDSGSDSGSAPEPATRTPKPSRTPAPAPEAAVEPGVKPGGDANGAPAPAPGRPNNSGDKADTADNAAAAGLRQDGGAGTDSPARDDDNAGAGSGNGEGPHRPEDPFSASTRENRAANDG